MHFFVLSCFFALCCNFGVSDDIGGLPSFLSSANVYISESQLPASKCCYLLQDIKHHRHNEPTKNTTTKEPVKRIPCVAIQFPNTGRALLDLLTYTSFIVVTTIRLIFSSLESQQLISSFKLLCCHHSNHSLSRTLDLYSLLLW